MRRRLVVWTSISEEEDEDGRWRACATRLLERKAWVVDSGAVQKTLYVPRRMGVGCCISFGEEGAPWRISTLLFYAE